MRINDFHNAPVATHTFSHEATRAKLRLCCLLLLLPPLLAAAVAAAALCPCCRRRSALPPQRNEWHICKMQHIRGACTLCHALHCTIKWEKTRRTRRQNRCVRARARARARAVCLTTVTLRIRRERRRSGRALMTARAGAGRCGHRPLAPPFPCLTQAHRRLRSRAAATAALRSALCSVWLRASWSRDSLAGTCRVSSRRRRLGRSLRRAS